MSDWTDGRRRIWLQWMDKLIGASKAAHAPPVVMGVLHSLGAALAAGYEQTLANQCFFVSEVLNHRIEKAGGFEAWLATKENWRWN